MVGFVDVDLSVTNPAGVPLSISGTADTVDADRHQYRHHPVAGAERRHHARRRRRRRSVQRSARPAAATSPSTTRPTTSAGGRRLQRRRQHEPAQLPARSAPGAPRPATSPSSPGGIFNLDDDISGRNIDITSVGFQADDTLLLIAAGRPLLHPLQRLDPGLLQLAGVRHRPDRHQLHRPRRLHRDRPTTGNGFFTNRTGTIAPPKADNPPVTKVYDGTPGFAFAQTGATATATLQAITCRSPFTVDNYSVTSSGAFTDKNAGVNKGHTVARDDEYRRPQPDRGQRRLLRPAVRRLHPRARAARRRPARQRGLADHAAADHLDRHRRHRPRLRRDHDGRRQHRRRQPGRHDRRRHRRALRHRRRRHDGRQERRRQQADRRHRPRR